MTNRPISLEDVEAAQEAVYQVARRTPIKRSTWLSAKLGGKVYFKLENFQRAGSFKVRGAANKIAQLTDDQKRAGVVAASAGNHAQGVALAATRAGIASTIFMPEDAPLAKQAATEGYGATVIAQGADYQECQELAHQHQQQTGATFVHAFDDPFTMAGQGTIGLEILEDIPDVDVVLVPVGGGGLCAGVATAIKAKRPHAQIIAVQAAGADALADSLAKGQVIPLESVSTMADGIAVRTVGSQTYDVMASLVDHVVTVTEDEIAQAILLFLERMKITVEGAGAVTLAALLSGKVTLQGRTACAIVSGGNIDITLLSRIINRGLIQEGRIAQFHLNLPDKPGVIAEVLTLLGKHKANVMHVRHERNQLELDITSTHVEVEVETRGPKHIQRVRKALMDAGYTLMPVSS